MSKCIIYQNDETGGVCIVTPVLDCGLTLEEIALKDVPAGKPYKIIDVIDFPQDATFADAWEVDMTNPDGYGLGHEAWYAGRT